MGGRCWHWSPSLWWVGDWGMLSTRPPGLVCPTRDTLRPLGRHLGLHHSRGSLRTLYLQIFSWGSSYRVGKNPSSLINDYSFTHGQQSRENDVLPRDRVINCPHDTRIWNVSSSRWPWCRWHRFIFSAWFLLVDWYISYLLHVYEEMLVITANTLSDHASSNGTLFRRRGKQSTWGTAAVQDALILCVN